MLLPFSIFRSFPPNFLATNDVRDDVIFACALCSVLSAYTFHIKHVENCRTDTPTADVYRFCEIFHYTCRKWGHNGSWYNLLLLLSIQRNKCIDVVVAVISRWDIHSRTWCICFLVLDAINTKWCRARTHTRTFLLI